MKSDRLTKTTGCILDNMLHTLSISLDQDEEYFKKCFHVDKKTALENQINAIRLKIADIG